MRMNNLVFGRLLLGVVALAVSALIAANSAKAALITAGELIADLQAADLDANSTTWTNQDTTGDTVGDFTAKTGNLSVAGIGGVSKALFVDENTDHAVLSAAAVPASVAGNNTRSVEAWVYATPSLRGSQGVVSWGTTGVNEFSRFTYAGGGNGLLSAWFNDAGWGGATLPLDEWVHVAWTWNDADNLVRGYINGDLQVTTAMNPTATLATTETIVTVGASRTGADADPFRGYIGDVRIHSGLLSDSDVANNYREGLSIPEPSTLLLIGLGLAGVVAARRR